MKEIRQSENVVLFLDELHTLIGAGAAEGAIDASNMLKPALSRGEIQTIGATTLDEYRKYIEKDGALERPVLLDVLAVLVERGGADGLDLAARQGRLQHVRGVDGTFGGTSPDQRVELVEEQHDVLRLADLLHDGLEPLLELAT